MKDSPELAQPHPEFSAPMLENVELQAAVLNELHNILESPFFHRSHRSSQFLRYVVEHKLNGDAEQLKERTIGVELFHRSPDYATGEDAVVRVQAGEVRRKLDQYYAAANLSGIESSVRIGLPVGSYSPVFHPASSGDGQEPFESARPQTASGQATANGSGMRISAKAFFLATICVALLGGAWLLTRHQQQEVPEPSLTRRFWEPIFGTPQPVLICLAKGVTYRPDEKLYDLYSHSHPGTFRTEVERSNDPLPLDPHQRIVWGDMNLYDDYGIAGGDVSSALRISEYLGSIGKPLQVRIGANYSFEDLRHSPAVVIGAFNNKWTIDLTSGLHFEFVELPGRALAIRESIPGGREWRVPANPATDYGIVSRLLNSKTGQFIVTAAGLTGSGTAAAGELATRREYLEEVLRSAPVNWERGNVQIVLQTSVMDGVPGPPRAVATYYWENR